jgi:hypothetical protein
MPALGALLAFIAVLGLGASLRIGPVLREPRFWGRL